MSIWKEDQGQMLALERTEIHIRRAVNGSWVNTQQAFNLVDILLDSDTDPEFTSFLVIEYLRYDLPFVQLFFFPGRDDNSATELKFWDSQSGVWESAEWTN